MARERADLGFSDALDEFDPEEWGPPKGRAANDKPVLPRPEKAATSQAAAAAGFRSREPKTAPDSRVGEGAAPRRRRTGRNAQFNLKAKPETIATSDAVRTKICSISGGPYRRGPAVVYRKDCRRPVQVGTRRIRS